MPCVGECLFTMLFETQGVYVKSDEETILKKRMEEAIVCLRTKRMDTLDEVIKINIEGLIVYAILKEEPYCLNMKNKSFRNDAENDSEEFLQSDEEEALAEEHGVENMEEEVERLEEDSEGTCGEKQISDGNVLGVNNRLSSKKYKV